MRPEILAAMESDKVAASRAMQQNNSMKQQIEELQKELVNLINSKVKSIYLSSNIVLTSIYTKLSIIFHSYIKLSINLSMQSWMDPDFLPSILTFFYQTIHLT